MKKIITNLLSLIALTNGINLLAYEYDFNNNTDIPLVIKIRPWGIQKDFYQIIPVEGSVKQVWEFGSEVGAACIASLEWAPWKGSDADYKKWASDRGRIPHDKQRAFGDQWRTAMNRMEMKLEPNEAYDLIVANSKSLAKGIDTLVCKAVELADKTGAFKKLLEGKTTGPIDKIKKLSEGFKELKQEVKGIVNSNDTNTSTNSGHSSGELTGNTNTKIQTSMDMDTGSMGMGMGTGMGMGMDNLEKSKCSFGIGQITKAAAEIAGNTNCKSRVYDIVFQLDDNDDILMDKSKRPLKPKLLAITRKGE